MLNVPHVCSNKVYYYVVLEQERSSLSLPRVVRNTNRERQTDYSNFGLFVCQGFCIYTMLDPWWRSQMLRYPEYCSRYHLSIIDLFLQFCYYYPSILIPVALILFPFFLFSFFYFPVKAVSAYLHYTDDDGQLHRHHFLDRLQCASRTFRRKQIGIHSTHPKES